MTILSLVPTRFPLETQLDNLPYKYNLKADERESNSTLLLLSLWAFAAIFLIHITTHPLALITGMHNQLIAAIGLAGVVGVVLFFGKKIARQLLLSRAGIMVSIDQLSVQVFNGAAGKDWRCPVSEFTGLMEVVIGNKQIAGRQQQIIALVLQHEDETRSVPLIYTRASQWDRSKIIEFAEALNVPILTEKRMVCGR